MTATRTIAGAALILSLAGCDDEPVVAQDDPVSEELYREAQEQWLDWALGQPHSTASPIADETGEFCDEGQHGKVWNLAGSFGGPVERTCTIPKRKYLFFPLVNRWVINPPDSWGSEEEYLEFATEWFAWHRENTCSLTLRLDGEDLVGEDLEALDEALYVVDLDPFDVDINADNWATEFGFLGGPTTTVADGHYALLRPLEPGEHTLEFGGVVCDGEAIQFETSAVYHLDVQ
jgi:hypothetical protein